MIGVGTSLLFDRRAGKAGPPIPPFNKAYVNILNEITECNDEKELRKAMKFISANYPITFNSLFDYGFGSNYMWVRERESHKPLLLVEF